jgi:hypothetical protein
MTEIRQGQSTRENDINQSLPEFASNSVFMPGAGVAQYRVDGVPAFMG